MEKHIQLNDQICAAFHYSRVQLGCDSAKISESTRNALNSQHLLPEILDTNQM